MILEILLWPDTPPKDVFAKKSAERLVDEFLISNRFILGWMVSINKSETSRPRGPPVVFPTGFGRLKPASTYRNGWSSLPPTAMRPMVDVLGVNEIRVLSNNVDGKPFRH